MGSKELFDELYDYLSIKKIDPTNQCRYCPRTLDCSKIPQFPQENISINWDELDSSVYKSITLQDIQTYKKLLNRKDNDVEELFDDDVNFDGIDVPSQKTLTPNILQLDDLIDKSILTDFFNESLGFEAPKTFNKLKNKCDSIVNCDIDTPSIRNGLLYEDSNKTKINTAILNEILFFFKLDSLEDMFKATVVSPQSTITYSPDIIEDTLKTNSSDDNLLPVSPVLGSCAKKSKPVKPNLRKLKRNLSVIESPSKFSMEKTKISSTPHFSSATQKFKVQEKDAVNLDLNDFCDLSMFGLSNKIIQETVTEQSNICGIQDLCDVTFLEGFDIRTNQIQSQVVTPSTSNMKSPKIFVSETQIGITQMLSFINEPSQKGSLSQNSPAKRRVLETDVDVFNFSFNSKKTTPTKKRKRGEDEKLPGTQVSSTKKSHIRSLFTNKPDGTCKSATYSKEKSIKKDTVFSRNTVIIDDSPPLERVKRNKHNTTVELLTTPKRNGASTPTSSNFDIEDSEIFNFSFNNKTPIKRNHHSNISIPQISLDVNHSPQRSCSNLKRGIPNTSSDTSIKNIPGCSFERKRSSDDEFEPNWKRNKSRSNLVQMKRTSRKVFISVLLKIFEESAYPLSIKKLYHPINNHIFFKFGIEHDFVICID